MEFRPCIDIHNGKVKQIVGGTLRDDTDSALENYVSNRDAAWFAEFYKKKKLRGGHIILLNPAASPFYEASRAQALSALNAYPQGFQIGGGVTAQNAAGYLNQGASHVIVTSYVFRDGAVDERNLDRLCREVGAGRLVLDLSCRSREGDYYIVTDRWQKYTQVKLTAETLDYFAGYCDEFLIHAVDAEGKSEGIEQELVKLLGDWGRIPVTYAGGVHSLKDLELLEKLGRGNIHVTIGSALNLFGGPLDIKNVLDYIYRYSG